MGQAVGQMLPMAIGIAFSPLPIVLVVLMLGTSNGRLSGLSFLAGWMFGLAFVGTTVLLVASAEQASSEGSPATWVSVLKAGLGVALLVLAVRQWRERSSSEGAPELPGWMQAVDTFSPAKAAATALLFSAVKPKNLILTIGAGSAIAQTGASTASQAGALAIFVVLASAGVGLPIAIYFFTGERATALLAELRAWLTRENTTIIAVICLIIGVTLIGDALSSLTT